jgi:hypothetical protein
MTMTMTHCVSFFLFCQGVRQGHPIPSVEEFPLIGFQERDQRLPEARVVR